MATGVTRIIQASQTQFISGIGSTTINFRVTISETYDEVQRTSNLHFSNLQMLLSGGNKYSTGYLNGIIRLKVGGTVYATVMNASSQHGAIHAPMSNTEWKTVVNDDASGADWFADVSNIYHAADGSLTVVVEFADLTILNPEGTSFSLVKVNTSVEVALTTIYNPSTLVTSGTNIGQAVSITVTRHNNAYTHTVKVTMLGRTETIATKSTTLSLSWTPSVTTYAPLMPNAKSATAVFTCETYLNNLLVGTTTKSVTLNLRSADVSPSLTLTIADIGGYATTYGAYVATKSRLRITANPTFKYGATLKTVNISANGANYNSSPATTQPIKASASTVTGSITDSRGFSASATNSITILPYSAPRLSYQLNRAKSDGTLDPSGAYLRVDYTATISALNNHNSITFKVGYRQVGASSYTEKTVTLSSYSATGYTLIALSTEHSYEIRLRLTDDFGTTELTDVLSSAAVTMDFLAGGNGASFGKVAENEYELDISESWKLHVRGEVLLDKYKAPSNPNLLLNPFFEVNQREAESASAGAYGVDMWKTASSTSYSVTENGLVCASTNGNVLITQDVEDGDNLSGHSVTLSAIVNGDTMSVTANLPTFGAATLSFSSAVKNNVYLRLLWNGTTLGAAVVSTEAVNNVRVYALKLEYGSIPTISNDSPPPKGDELIRCQRHFYRIKSLTGGAFVIPGVVQITSTPNRRARISIPMHQMVSNPTPSLVGDMVIYGFSGGTVDVESMQTASALSVGTQISFTTQDAPLQGFAMLQSGAYIDLVC